MKYYNNLKKLIYIQDNFLDPSLCKPFIDLFSVKKEDRSLDAVTHSDPNETLTYMPEFKFDKNYGAKYLGGNVDPITLNMTDDELFSNVINSVTDLCKTFESEIVLDYVGVVRWPIGTYMKPHVDDNNVHKPDIFAAMLYLNDDFEGGSTMFEDIEVKPESGKLVIFSNSQHLHYVSKVDKSERFVLSFWYSRP